ncbi:phytoene dehydrogenase-like protein [Streptomyces aurantiacus]|uniref:NAD(P)-binding protein n=1 Tax=Streptomyces aurantiacus TaxID=47760 RepID=UPI0027923142|nr:NAD(P)-binding protein [Streptomyces aurantiacus]MDQ0779059.1 phytoene dehydrogenase-like protein [Streptomyces aurantiacus]
MPFTGGHEAPHRIETNRDAPMNRHPVKTTAHQQATAAVRAPRAVMIGSGIGGSALTLLLAHAGLPVTLLEKNKHLGGSCAGYDKRGFRIDFGTHLFTRGPSGPLGQVLQRAGHPDALQFRRTRDFAELRYTAHSGTQEVESIRLPWRLHRMPVFALHLVRQMGLSAEETGQAVRLLTKMLTMSPRAADAWNHRTVDESSTVTARTRGWQAS